MAEQKDIGMPIKEDWEILQFDPSVLRGANRLKETNERRQRLNISQWGKRNWRKRDEGERK